MTSRPSPSAPSGSATSYRETLYAPWWWYLVAVFAAGLLAVEAQISVLDFTDWIVLCVLVPVFAVLVWSLGRWRVEIVGSGMDAELRVRGAHIALQDVGGAVVLDARTLRRVVGREADPAAFVTIRPWIGPGMQLWVDAPDDPTPYWVVSTRHPEQLLDAVRAHT